MRKIAIIICICLLTISVGLLDVHNGNLDGFLLMLVGITCFVSAVVPPITFYLHVILPYKKIAESIHKADRQSEHYMENIKDDTLMHHCKGGNLKGNLLISFLFKSEDVISNIDVEQKMMKDLQHLAEEWKSKGYIRRYVIVDDDEIDEGYLGKEIKTR